MLYFFNLFELKFQKKNTFLGDVPIDQRSIYAHIILYKLLDKN